MTERSDFSQILASTLQDLRTNGIADGEAMTLIGSLAADIADRLKVSSWSAAKARIDRQLHDQLLKSFQDQGNALHKAGNRKQAYAVQALAVSLVARTQTETPGVREGEHLLDALLDRAVEVYRHSRPTH
ncbi:MAG: hypothetical protein KIT02_06360 [Devosia sp.]|uniref:hypothetical protein n=1 Tax=Devosia sp. TaxID=1871048 RepID=UPI0024CCE45D|nr:hypothetical protein [Devosia sp.]UYO00826.1 MAG: hypothetical protein KIT02_06360 [Devosia sp.]